MKLDNTIATVNSDLLRRTIEHVEAHPDEWDQAHWAGDGADCGTTCCLAGWACRLSGLRIDWDRQDGNGQAWWLTDGRLISTTAQQLLGLTDTQAMELFYEGNDLDDLRRLVALLAGEAHSGVTA